jgi:hypothetical protein
LVLTLLSIRWIDAPDGPANDGRRTAVLNGDKWFYLILAASSSGVAMVGAVAQLGEHLLCKQGVSGSIPLSSTNLNLVSRRASGRQYPLKKNVFARRFRAFCACSAYIVKRRLIWRLPGVLGF